MGDGDHSCHRAGKICRSHAGKTGIHRKANQKEAEVHKESPAGKETEGKSSAGIFSQDIINQLNVVFSRMEGNLQT